MLNGSFQAFTCHYLEILDRPFMAELALSESKGQNRPQTDSEMQQNLF
jgi:hypothetical protein